MKYFVKLLPVEENPKISKMFLCSRDIKIGDIIYDSKFNTKYLYTEEIDFDSDIPTISGADITGYKIIGKISPEANWLKEGMEFSEDEIKVQFIEGDFEGRQFTLSEGKVFYGNSPHKAPIHILLKGSCGHFH